MRKDLAAMLSSVVRAGCVFALLLAAGVARGQGAAEAIEIAAWPAPILWRPPADVPSETAGQASAPRPLLETSVPTPPLPLIGIPPCRIADTRGNGFTGPYGPPSLAAGSPRSFVLTGQCGIPATAQAVSLNVTVTNTLGPGFVKIFPEAGASPMVSTLNFVAGQTIANAAVVPLGTGGGVTVGAAAGTDLILDTNGYYDASGLIRQVSPGAGLTGGGTSGNVTLGIAAGGVTSTQLAANAVTAGAIASGQVVKSVNGLFDGVTLAAGSNLTINKSGQTLTFSSVASGWGLTGNAGTGCTTSPCSDFLGTTDNDALELRVNNRRAFRIEPAVDSTGGLGYAPNVIGGFETNSVTGGAAGTTIAGGGASGVPNSVSASFGAVGGGAENVAGGVASTVSGGAGNSTTSDAAVVAGGNLNSAYAYSAVGGGYNNNAAGSFATVPGGASNEASGYGSFAAGQGAMANSDGCFVWADGTGSVSCGGSFFPHRFVVMASGGTFFYSNSTGTTGVILQPGSGSWSSVSDRNVKENFEPVDGRVVLRRLMEIPISSWNYKGADAPYRHLGPMAQDFYAAFHLGEDDRHITTIDEEGVALAAIQGLSRIVEEKDAKIRGLEARLDALEAIVKRLATAN